MNVSEKINSIIAEGMLDNQFMAAQRQNYALEVKLKEMQKELLIKTSKAEAIREFADNIKIAMKTRFSDEIEALNPHFNLASMLIDDLVEEMTEGNNG